MLPARPGGWRQALNARMNNNDTAAASGGTTNNNLTERVRNAFAVVASGNQINQTLQPPPPPPNVPMLTNTTINTISRPAQLVQQAVVNKSESNAQNYNNTLPVGSINSVTVSSAPSNITVKNRFKHSRPLLSSNSTATDKKLKTSLEHESCHTTSNTTTSSLPLTHSFPVMRCNAPQLQPSPMHMVNTATTIKTQSVTCPFCPSNVETECMGSNFYHCRKCDRKWMHYSKVQLPPQPASTFYGGAPQGGKTATTTNTAVATTSTKKRTAPKSSKSAKKKKTIETVDLVSSDEEDKKSSTLNAISSAQVPPSTTNTNQVVANPSSQQNATMESRQATLSSNAVVAPPTSMSSSSSLEQPSPAPSPSPSPSPTPPGEYKFHTNKAMFGELYGCSIAPTRVADNRMYLSLECIIYRNAQPVSEKYTLSVGQNDVQQIKVYFGRIPSFVAIETASRFAEVACKRIGRDVLVPNSTDHKKRYIILALVSAFKNDTDAATELKHLLATVSSWARIHILQLGEAKELIQNAQLDVDQQERCYGTQLKPAGPVETLLIYPSPPKSGGIPVTTEDVACLAEGTYLNDIIIDFYLKYLYEDRLTDAQREKTYMFNSYFYKRLTQKSSKSTPSQMHAAVKKWTRNVDIFSKDFVIIPVNEHCHWYLVILCFPGLFFECQGELGEKDEEESEDEAADFIKETNEGGEIIATAATELLSKLSDTTDKSLVSVSSTPGNEESSSSSLETTTSTVCTSNATPPSTSLNTPTLSNPTSDESPQDSTSSTLPPVLKKEKQIFKQAFQTDPFKRPCVLIFDSLVGSGHSRVFTNLRNYLAEEWRNRKPDKPVRTFDKNSMKGCYPKIPRQNNDCDCGVFLLQYVESFFDLPVKNFRIPMHLEDWFTLEFMAGKREHIKTLINQLAEKYKNSK